MLVSLTSHGKCPDQDSTCQGILSMTSSLQRRHHHQSVHDGRWSWGTLCRASGQWPALAAALHTQTPQPAVHLSQIHMMVIQKWCAKKLLHKQRYKLTWVNPPMTCHSEHERLPWQKATLMKDCPDDRQPWWKSILMKDCPDDRPPWWKTALMTYNPDEGLF